MVAALMYGKLFAAMYDGTLYGNWKALVTFQQMIILADRTGIVDMTPQAIAARTSIPLKIIREGIEVLEAPDEYSRSPDAAGRRIERLDQSRPWGWRVVNYVHYRNLASADEKRAKDRERIAEKRHVAKCRKLSLDVANVANVAHADADADADIRARAREAVEGLDPQAWDRWVAYRRDIRKPIKPASMLAAMRQMARLGADQADAVERSIANGWTGVFARDARKPAKPASEWE